MVQTLFQDPSNDSKLQKVLDVINNSTILPDCEKVVQDYSEKAHLTLKALPGCDPKRSLLDLADYVISRRR